MNSFKRFFAAILAGVIVLTSLFSCKAVKEGAELGDVCYNYSLKKIDATGSDNIKNHRGRVVVIHFFGIWSGGLNSAFDTVASEYSGEATVLAIHTDHEKSAAPTYIEQNFASSKIIFLYDERNGNSEDKYYTLLGGVDTYPRTLVLDKDGKITFIKDGDMTYDELVTAINDAK